VRLGAAEQVVRFAARVVMSGVNDVVVAAAPSASAHGCSRGPPSDDRGPAAVDFGSALDRRDLHGVFREEGG
jgi:hypothetical protein